MKLHKMNEQFRKKSIGNVLMGLTRFEITLNGQFQATHIHVCNECALANLNKNLDEEKCKTFKQRFMNIQLKWCK